MKDTSFRVSLNPFISLILSGMRAIFLKKWNKKYIIKVLEQEKKIGRNMNNNILQKNGRKIKKRKTKSRE